MESVLRSWVNADLEAGRCLASAIAAARGWDDPAGDGARAHGNRAARGERSRWFAVQTRPQAELRARAHLENQDFRTFLPLCLRSRRHARRIDTVKVPLFPGYLFVRLDLSRDRWRSVNGTVGVVSLVMFAGAPQPVPAGIVERLAALTDARGIVCFDAELRRGQSVRLTTGPFAELLGVLERLDDAGRARVLLTIMGGRVAVSLSSSAIVPAAT